MGDRNASTSLLGGHGGSGISTRKKIMVVLAVALVVAIVVVGISLALYYRDNSTNVNISESLTVGNIMSHLNNFNMLANTSTNSRSVMDAYNASAKYVIDTLTNDAKDFCDIQTQFFTVPIYVQLATPILVQYEPYDISYVLNRDFSATRYGGNGTFDISAPAIVADNFGCNYPDDWNKNFTDNIAVVFDGTCTQYQKALYAEQAGAVAILIVNANGSALANWRVRSVEWNASTPLIQIPVLGLTYSLGVTLKEQYTHLHITSSTKVTIEDTFNVFCLTKKGSQHDILVMGSHLDSVPEGPGINDNGSGSATVLEVALEVARTSMELKNKVLFAWWGAEEIGLLGSRYFVSKLVEQSQPGYPLPPFSQTNYLPALNSNNTLLNLNFDMLGSPNFVRQVYNSSAQTRVVNDASFRIQKLFEEFFISKNAPYEIIPMSGGSDFFPFIENGWPAGALATGASSIKTVQQRDIFGGFANTPLDPCYHLSCDTIANIDVGVLQDMSKAAAYVVQKLADHSNLRQFLYD